MNVLINGAGNIGTTLANILSAYKEILSIDVIYLNKNTPTLWTTSDLDLLSKKGIFICTSSPDENYKPINEVINKTDYIFDSMQQGGGLKNLPWYQSLSKLKGACAQGTEKGFGISFMTGVNAEKIRNKKFVHIVSCNTHSTASILQTFAGKDLKNLQDADIVAVRRSEDIGNHERLVSASVVSRHLNTSIGTHHAIDVKDLFKSTGINIFITSSDITTPSQLMHAARFNITLIKEKESSEIDELINSNEFVATTNKFDSNRIYELGRRYGFQGRIYSHAIIVSNNLLLNGNKIKGWMFVPQEGNTILSTIESYLLQTNNNDHKAAYSQIKEVLLLKYW